MNDKLLSGYEATIPGGGTMGELIRSYDWSPTSVGAIENWSPSLKTALSMMLSSRFPMFIWWGKELINFYNDAYIPVLGARHPEALGMSAPHIWADVWDALSPQIEGVLQAGRASWNEGLFLIMERNGYPEETYFTFSYSPIFEDGSIAGLFCACTEDTGRVLNDRRIKTLRDLAAETVKAKTVEDAGEMAIATLEHNPQDLPFALLYLLNETESLARLIATTKSIEGMSVCPVEVELENGDDLWSLEQVLRSGESQVIQLNESKYGSLPGGAWSESPKLAVVLPIAFSGQTVKGWLIAGVSPVRELDNDYQGFFDLISGQIATAIANARAYEAEKQRAEALAEIDRAKTTFFSNVSHEFRTPLTLMLSPLEDALFDTQEPLPPLQRQRIEVIQRNAMRLLKLVNTLLDFSRIEAGRIQAVYQPTDLATLTAELASVFRSAIEQSGMELIVDCPTLPEAIYVDRDLWEKIVLNLISNAFKFTFSGSIAVRLRWYESQVELSVADTGIGIPPAELSRLFERFYRVEGSRGRSIEGSGIGLSLVKELVELHDGTITVTSTEGSGSCFTVAIPTGSAHLPSDRIGYDASELTLSTSVQNLYQQEISSLVKNAPRSNTPLQIANNETPPNPVNSNTVNSTVRILVADDNADMRDYLERLLTPSYTIETVADGITALNTIKNNPPDLVLSDVMMPEMDGFELLRSLRAEPLTQEIPIILLSARAGEESRIEGLEAGADDYLIKPFSTRELLARIEATLKLAQLRKTAQTLRQQTETAEANLQNILTSLRDGFYSLDRDWRFTYVSDRQLEIVARSREEMIGKCIWDLYPDVVDSDFYHQVHRGMAERIFFKFDYHYPTWDRWYEHRVYPLPDGLAILCAEITERKQIEQEREQLLARETEARSKAEELNRLKDEFLAIVSHELRTPLNPILGWSQLLATGRLDSEQTAKGIAIVKRNAQLQAQLIEDLLDVSRILRDKIELDKTPVDLQQVIKAAIATVQLTAEAKSISITTKFEPNVGLVLGDSGRLQQIIWNLLANAVKFTPEGGRVTVTLSSNGKSATIQVRDTGKGIEPEFLPYIFDRFRQADSTSTRNFGGLGLGLAIVQHLTKLHDGAIAVESLGKDRGSTFTVELPLASIDAEMPPDPTQDNVVQPKKLTGIRVLAVDDEADSLSLLAFILEQEGAEVTTATSATEALKILLESTFDLLISDIGMPEVNGYELIRKIRSMPSPIAAIKAIALTAYAGESDIQQARKAGFQQHIAKPLDVNISIDTAIELLTSEAKGFDL